MLTVPPGIFVPVGNLSGHNLRILPKVTVVGRSHCTWSRRRLDSLGFSGGFTSLETVKVEELGPVYSLSRLPG